MDAHVAECKERMHKAVVHLQDEFSGVRTGRATPALVSWARTERRSDGSGTRRTRSSRS